MSVELTTLGEYARVQGGYAYKSKDFSESGTCPVLKIKNVRFGNVDYAEASYISEEVAKKTIDWKTKEGDILISMTGSGPNAPQSLVGRVARVWENEPESWVNQRVGRIVLKEERLIHPDFLFYLLSSPRSQDYLVSNSSGSANQANISGKVIESLPCPKVDYDQSAEIAKILRELDKKIRINRQTNQTLEQIAQAIFKSWFVDFEPVKAKIQAKQFLSPSLSQEQRAQAIERAAMCAISGQSLEELEKLSPETQQQLKTTAALFPDALVESELGEVPEGWGVIRFKQIIKKYIDNRGKTPPVVDSGIPLLEVKHLPENSMKPNLNTTKYVDDETYKNWFRAHLEADDIIISTVGTIGRICIVPENVKFTIAQNLLGMRFNKEKASPYFMYYQMDGFRFRHDVDARLIITVQASIKRKDLETIDLLSPPISVQNAFEIFVKSFVKVQQSNQEIQLSKIRDVLLPKLLSGEISPNYTNLLIQYNEIFNQGAPIFGMSEEEALARMREAIKTKQPITETADKNIPDGALL